MSEQTNPLTDPRRSQDDWARKIEIAKQAREAGKAIRRQNKTPVVATSLRFQTK